MQPDTVRIYFYFENAKQIGTFVMKGFFFVSIEQRKSSKFSCSLGSEMINFMHLINRKIYRLRILSTFLSKLWIRFKGKQKVSSVEIRTSTVSLTKFSVEVSYHHSNVILNEKLHFKIMSMV